MTGIFVERHSSAAKWCQRFALFLIPYFLIVILLYRFGKVETSQLFALMGVGFLVALVSLILAMRAIADLWSKGYRGGSKVVRGLFITLITLLPFGYFTFLALQYPLANDVSTDAFNPPDYITAPITREEGNEIGFNAVGEYNRPHALKILSSYPKLQPRRYPAGPERVLEAVRKIIQDNEWPVTGSQGIPEIHTDPADEELADNQQESDATPNAEETLETPDDVYIEFLERTLIMGFENDIVVRIVSEDRNTLVDVRSSSRWGSHDFGYNARLIESFLQELDAALLGIAGEG
jgi:hypothetical protein